MTDPKDAIEQQKRAMEAGTSPYNNILTFPSERPSTGLYSGHCAVSAGYRSWLRTWLKDEAWMRGVEWEEDWHFLWSAFRYKGLSEKKAGELTRWLEDIGQT